MWTPTGSEGRQRCVRLLIAVLVSIAWACGSEPITAPTAPSATPAPTPPPGPRQVRVSGVVLDDLGAGPIANATVMLRHNQGELITRTDGRGAYEFSFVTDGPYRQPAPPSRVVPQDTLGLLITGDGRSWGDNSRGHWTSVQLLPWGATEIEHNVRLRPVTTLTAGQSMPLLFVPDSSLLWDYEYEPWSFVPFDTLREEFLVSVPTDGILTIDVRANAGGVAATLNCQYGGCSSFRGQGPISLPVQGGHTHYFSVEIPRTSAPQRFDIQTSLR